MKSAPFWMNCMILCGFVIPAMGVAAEMPADALKAAGIEFHISARTPEQTSAFYAARGLPTDAVRAIAQVCLLTVGMRNNRSDVVWMDLAEWRFIDDEGRPVQRIQRIEWDAVWEQMAVPDAGRATFGWTQLPDIRDLQPGEPVGGNLAVVPPQGNFTLQASFKTGVAKDGPVIRFNVPELSCPGRVP
jgi:hypothetical protein